MTRVRSPLDRVQWLPRLGPASWAALVAVPTVLLIALIATSPRPFGSTWRMGSWRAAGQELGAAAATRRSGPPATPAPSAFIPPPPPSTMEPYVDCILHPTLTAAGSTQQCGAFKVPEPFPADIKAMRVQPSVLVNHSSCARLAGFPEGDEREILYEPVAAYARPNTSDGYAWLQVFCLEFDYLKLLIPYVPADRPLAILDAGANAGFASFLFARFMRFQGELVSVEMNPASARMVRRNTAALNAVPGMRSLVVNRALVSAEEERATPEVRFSGSEDGKFLANRLESVKEHAGSEYGAVVNSVSLPTVLGMADAPAFDFIKLDIEGAEHTILQDPESHRVLCAARCVFAELHERYKPGIEAAWADFVATGCPAGRRMRELTNTGEYSVVCREDL